MKPILSSAAALYVLLKMISGTTSNDKVGFRKTFISSAHWRLMVGLVSCILAKIDTDSGSLAKS